ncbi:hypothetical protein [Nonomuraea endophytica]|uniref:hypothetical protein n=1 Tax=Nonomuraea endophytica TaxID=714136 RepID=UPI0037C6D05B
MKTILSASAFLAFAAITAPSAALAAPQATWWRVETVSIRTADEQAGSGANRYWLDHKRAASLWLSKDGTGWTGSRQLAPVPHSPQDKAVWKQDGAPTTWKLKDFGYTAKPDAGHLAKISAPEGLPGDLTIQELQTLPAQPGLLKEKLRAELIAEKVPAAELEWEITSALADLLYKAPVPQQVKLAAFEAFKNQPGIQQLGSATDALGRTGLKFSIKTSDSDAFNEEYSEDFGSAKPEGAGLAEIILEDPKSGKPCVAPKPAEGEYKTAIQEDAKPQPCLQPKPGVTPKATEAGGVLLAQDFIIDPKTVSLLASKLNVTSAGKPVPGKNVDLIVKQAGWSSEKPAVPAAG